MKRVWEKIVEGILTCSGFITSITILLIVVFLFAEALGLFNKKVIEEGYVLAVNKANPVQELSAAQIKDVLTKRLPTGKSWEDRTRRLKFSGWRISPPISRRKSWEPSTRRHPGASARSLPVIQASSPLFPSSL